MQLGYLYGSFQGRINRKPFWWGTVLLLVVLTAISIGAFATVGPSLSTDLDPDDPRLKTFIFVMQAISLVSLYPGLALTVKRLHDRDQSGYVAGFLYLPLLVKEVTDLAGITGDPENPGPLDLPLNAIVFIVSIVFLILLGFLRGTAGPNRYGADPLGTAAPRPGISPP
jgi:uncharacterized membrane protein YhaH (DUF805 family)